MSATEIAILQRFKDSLLQFLDELINWMPNDEELLMTRILVKDQLPINEIMKKFVTFILPFSEQIANRDEQFFLNDPKIFGGVQDKTRVMSLKKLWTHAEFGKEDKEKAWMWMDFFIKCTKMYLEHKT